MPSEEVIEFLKKKSDFDDGRAWGHVTDDGVWHPLPKTPLLLADLGPPPFSVKLPSGEYATRRARASGMTTLWHPPISDFVMHLKAKFGLDTLVETGTFMGESTLYAAQRFQYVVTIDVSNEHHTDATSRCSEHRNIDFMLCDTRLGLPWVVEGLDGPAMFWIDAHAGVDLFGPRDDWPALDELRIINRSPFKHFILIDDAHCFLPGTPYPACPTMDEIEAEAGAGGYAWRINHDVIALVPAMHIMELVQFGDAP